AGGGVLALGLEEHERVAPEVGRPVHDRGVEAAPHRGRAGDRVGARRLADPDLDVDDGLGAVAGGGNPRVREMLPVGLLELGIRLIDRPDARDSAHADLAGAGPTRRSPKPGVAREEERMPGWNWTPMMAQNFPIVKIF